MLTNFPPFPPSRQQPSSTKAKMMNRRILLARFLLLWLFSALLLSSCRKKDGDAIGVKGLYLSLPFQWTLKTHKVFETLKLSKKEFRQKLRARLIKGGWHYENRKNLSPSSLYFVQLGLSANILSYKRLSSKALDFKIGMAIRFDFSPKDKKKEYFAIEEKKELHYRVNPWDTKWRISKNYRHFFQQQGRHWVSDICKEGVQALLLYWRLQQASPEQLLRYIQGRDDKKRYYALRVLALKPYKKAIPAVLAALKSKRKRVVLAAIRVLVRMKTKRAVLPLIELARGQNRKMLTQIISALSVIGGKEAESYLFTLAGGHPSFLVRQVAKEAWQEIRQKTQH